MSEFDGTDTPRCSYCGTLLLVVHVHGHGQCSVCGTNVDPCCAGASPESEARLPEGQAPPIDRGALRRAFEEAGGAQATITEAAFLFALGRVLDVSLEEGRVALEAAAELGLVRRLKGSVRAAREL